MIHKHDLRMRVNFSKPIKGSLSIYKFQEKSLPEKTSFIQVNNISVNGLDFSSHLNFPVDPRIKLSFKLPLLGQTHDLYGVIVWGKQIEGIGFRYGVKLDKTQIGYIKSVLILNGELKHEDVWKLNDVS